MQLRDALQPHTEMMRIEISKANPTNCEAVTSNVRRLVVSALALVDANQEALEAAEETVAATQRLCLEIQRAESSAFGIGPVDAARSRALIAISHLADDLQSAGPSQNFARLVSAT